MSQKLNLPLKEVTLCRFEFQSVSLQAIEYSREPVTVLFERFREHEYIVQITIGPRENAVALDGPDYTKRYLDRKM